MRYSDNMKMIAGLLFILLIPVILHSQDYSEGKASPLFQSHEIVHLSIKADLKTLLSDIDDEREQHPAILEYVENEDTIRLDVQLRTRGNFRRKPDQCSFPPLRLNLKKKQVEGTIFEGIDKIKIVTHCRPNQKRYQQYLIREYLVYRAFNLVTDTSLRVRLASITYLDTSNNNEKEESFAILIEPDEAFEKRFNARRSDQKYLFPDSTSYVHMGKLAFFQYMIGNTDYAVTTQHNIMLFTLNSDQPPYSIPYDFDWCGAVNTHYAVPLPRFGTQNVTERIYRGQCRSMEEFMQIAAFFNSKKEDIFNLYNDYPLLSKREKRELLHYFKGFYDVINDERQIKVELLENCLK
ncbi:MAG: hypothetical protein IH598_14100 [Bacteroidales bacterium]|nr:hypothetical protein [Bacteroidales bacterium]